MECPICGGDVPRKLLRSKTFECPTCKVSLRVKDLSQLLTIVLIIVLLVCGYWLSFVIGEQLGLEGNGLFTATLFLGPIGGVLVSVILGVFIGGVVGVAPQLEDDPGPTVEDGRILHIDSPPPPRNPPQ